MSVCIHTGGNLAVAAPTTTTPTTPAASTTPVTGGNLAGEWETSDYRCAGGKKTERVRITQDGTHISAVKTLGDDCVQTGQESFTGTVTGDRGKVRWWKGSPGVKPVLFPAEVDLVIQDGNTFVVSDPPGKLTFVRTSTPN